MNIYDTIAIDVADIARHWDTLGLCVKCIIDREINGSATLISLRARHLAKIAQSIALLLLLLIDTLIVLYLLFRFSGD